MLESVRAKLRHRTLIDLWIRYHDVVNVAMDFGEATPDQERAFLELKAKIAAHLQFLPGAVPSGLDAEVRKEVEEITNMLKRHRSLDPEDEGSPWEREEFGELWHGHYIFLSKLGGTHLKSGQVPPPPPRPRDGVPTGLGKRWLEAPVPRTGTGFRILIRVAVVVFAVYIVGSALGLQLRPGGHFSIDTPGSIGQAFGNILNALSAVWFGFFGPLVSTYGMFVTIFLVGILILLSGYWVFLRG